MTEFVISTLGLMGNSWVFSKIENTHKNTKVPATWHERWQQTRQ